MKKLIIFAAIIVLAFLTVFIWYKNGSSPVNSKNTSSYIFVIPKGDGLRAISNRLKEEGLIRDAIVFFLLVKQNNLDTKIQAGDYKISPSMSALEIAAALTKGSMDVWVTIPEGKRAEEVAEILKNHISTYQDSWADSLKQYEGYLFPDTYLLPKDAEIDTIASIMRKTFDEKFSTIKNAPEESKEKIVIIASMIEREAKHAEDRPLVSSVIHNRLEIDMPLQIDATIQYALGKQIAGNWWKKELSIDDLKIGSLYNTYTNTGLPPAPIANPGLKSLEAAANPSETDYIYYLSDKNGVNHYSKTLAEHNANIKKYL